MDSVEDLRKGLQQDREEFRSLIFPAMDEIREGLKDVATVKATVELTKLRERFRQKRAELRPSDTHSQQFGTTFDPVSRYSDHMCQWLFTDPHYQLWEHDNTNTEKEEILYKAISEGQEGSQKISRLPNLFYIQARPGFGKSVTLASAIRRLSSEPDSMIGYFFFKQGDDVTQLSLRALTSLATQLFDEKHAQSEDELIRLTAVLEQTRTTASSSTVEGKETTSSVVFTSEMLKEAIKNIASAIKRRIYIVVDGIDECIDHEQEELVQYLTNLADLPNFRVMISSRENEDLENFFTEKETKEVSSEDGAIDRSSSCIVTSKATILNITEERNAADMELYLRSSLQRIMAHRSVRHHSHAKTEKDTLRIITRIKQKANGMFTYAAIVIASLEQPSQLTLTQKLKNLPEGMDDLYRQRLEDLSFEEKKLVLVALKFIVWGFGSVTTLEIAEHFKRVYEDVSEDVEPSSPVIGNEEEDEKSEDTAVPSSSEAARRDYDAMEDPEIAETVYHLSKAGRDFFKFSNNQKDIEVVHKTVRDWVKNEADKIKTWHETTGAAKPKLAINEKGELNISLPIPPGLLSGGRVTALCNPKFIERYMGFKTTEGAKNELTKKEKGPENNEPGASTTDIAGPAHARATFSISTYEDEEDEPARYEAAYLINHLNHLEELWPKLDRQGPKWERLWELLRKFLSPKPFSRWLAQYLRYEEGYSRDIAEKESNGFQPLHIFASTGVLIVVEFLLVNEKADPNVMDAKNRSPFIFSLEQKEIMKLLLSNGADINITYKGKSYFELLLNEIWTDGWLRNNVPPRPDLVEIFKLLFDAGVDVNQKIPLLGPKDTTTALHVAVASKSLEFFNIIMAHPDVNVNAQDQQQMTPLNWMNFSPNSKYPLEVSKSMTKALLEAGADPNNQDANSGAPLAFAVTLQDKDVVELLLQHGADVNDDNHQGLTALHYAASATNRAGRGTETAEAITRLLLMYGADFEKEGKDGEPILLRAAWSGYEKVFMILINEYQKKYGSDQSFLLKKFGESQKTYFRSAAQNKTSGVSILKYLVRNWTAEQLQDMLLNASTIKENALHLAAGIGNIGVIKLLLELGADVDIRSNYGTAFDHAVWCWAISKKEMAAYTEETLKMQTDLEEVAFFFLEKAPHLAKGSKVALPWAIKRYNEKLISKLCECGYDIEQLDNFGWSPYEYAYAERRLESLREMPGFSTWFENPTRQIRKTSVPSKLVNKETPSIFRVSDDGLSFETIEGFVDGYGISYYEKANCLQTDFPTSAHRPIFYWEISLLDFPPMHQGFSLGFMGGGAAMRTPPGSSSANGDTFGLWSDGQLQTLRDAKYEIHNVQQTTYITRLGTIAFGKGDTVGCGYSMDDGVIFYTLNGKYLGTAFDDVRGRLYPAFGSYVACKGRVNFGAEPFAFEDMTEYYANLKE
ncbi:Ankyrin-3 [Dactylellina cionopaga]|nr:Ankyrin-3 [Dactylellina cionopaga]